MRQGQPDLRTCRVDGTPKEAYRIGQITKIIWEHINKHGLQDPADRRVILLDSALKAIFNVVGVFIWLNILGHR